MLALAVLLTVALVTPGGSAGTSLPKGFRVTNVRRVAPGVVHLRIESKDQRIHVARIAPDAPVSPRVAVAKRGVGPQHGRQRTSAMCRRVDCLIGVNGDFYYTYGRTAGAVVIDGEPWITRRYDRPHLIIGADGSYDIGRFDVPIEMQARYPHALESIDERLGRNDFRDERVSISVDGINSERASNALIIYTPRRGPRTETGAGGVDLVAKIVTKPKRLLLRDTAGIELLRLQERGNARIPKGGIVLSGRGRSAETLRQLWRDVRDGTAHERIRITLRGPRAAQVIGGRPVLVRNGAALPQGSDSFAAGRHARTIAGWTTDGTLYLVTVDDRGRAQGMSLDEAARFMQRLGVTAALNLDGGGSTTFVRRGSVRNQPADGWERYVASSLLIVRD